MNAATHGGRISPRGVAVMGEAMEEAVRRLDGLEAFRISEEVAVACVMEGQPYPTFLSQLIGLGLDQWKRDRLAVGKAIP